METLGLSGEIFGRVEFGEGKGQSGVTKPLEQGSVLCILQGRMLNVTVVSFPDRFQQTTVHTFLYGLQVNNVLYIFIWLKKPKNTVDP